MVLLFWSLKRTAFFPSELLLHDAFKFSELLLRDPLKLKRFSRDSFLLGSEGAELQFLRMRVADDDGALFLRRKGRASLSFIVVVAALSFLFSTTLGGDMMPLQSSSGDIVLRGGMIRYFKVRRMLWLQNCEIRR